MRFPHKISEHEKFATFFTYIFQFTMLFAFQLQLCIESFASYKKNIYMFFPLGVLALLFYIATQNIATQNLIPHLKITKIDIHDFFFIFF